MLQPERISATNLMHLVNSLEQVTERWMAIQKQPSDRPLLLLIDGCRQCGDQTLAELLQLLSKGEQDLARRLQQPDDQARHIIARASIRLILSKIIGQPASKLEIGYGPNGKPQLISPREGGNRAEFNISHSHDLALIGIHLNRSIGVDIEYHRPIAECLAIARRVFDGATYQNLAALSGEELYQEFYSCWCRLEAGLKASGSGLGTAIHKNVSQDFHKVATPHGYSGWISTMNTARNSLDAEQDIN